MRRYVVFAGVNGAGKTTLYQTDPHLQKMPRVNVDEIVRSSGSWRNSADILNAGMKAVKLIREYFSKGISFNQETTLCGRSILKNLYTAKEKGYIIELFFVGLNSPETAKKRVRQRVRDGGHGIPEEDIERRYHESIRNLKNILPLCDRAELYDNTDFFRQAAVFENGKCMERDSMIPNWCKGILDE